MVLSRLLFCFLQEDQNRCTLCLLHPICHFPGGDLCGGIVRLPHHAVGCDGIQDSHDRIHQHEFLVLRQMKVALCPDSLMDVFLWFIPRRVKGWKLRLAVGGGITASHVAAYGAWFFAVLVPSGGWASICGPSRQDAWEYGYVLSTAVSLRYVVKKPPQGYSNARLKEIYRRLEENPENPPEDGQPCQRRSI